MIDGLKSVVNRLGFRWFVALAASVAVAVWMDAQFDGPGAIALQLAGTPEAAKAAIDGYASLEPIRRAVRIDFLFIVAYVALGYASVDVARKRFYLVPTALGLADRAIIAIFAAGAFDVAENLFILDLISSDSIKGASGVELSASQTALITGLALAKFAGILVASSYALPGLIGVAWRSSFGRGLVELVASLVYVVLWAPMWVLSRITKGAFDRQRFVRWFQVQNLERPKDLLAEEYRTSPSRQFDVGSLGVPVQKTLSSEEAPDTTSRAGVCFSGGGIRSGTFSLGALQALQDQQQLSKAQYLTAVSGGGYIAGAYSMVRNRLQADTSQVPKEPLALGTPEERWIRNRCAWLAHTYTQKLTLVSRLFLGIGVNAAFIFLCLFVALRPIAWFLSERLPGYVADGEVAALALPTAHWVAVGVAVVLGTLMGLLSLSPTVATTGPGYERIVGVIRAMFWVASAAALVLLVLPFAVWLIYGFIPDLIPDGVWNWLLTRQPEAEASEGAIRLVALFAAGGALGFIGTAARKQLEALEPTVWMVISAAIVAPVLVLWACAAVLLAPMGAGIEGTVSAFGVVEVPERTMWLACAIGLGMLWLVSDQRAWSMHPFYKRRLHRAFAVKRRSADEAEEIDFGSFVKFEGASPEFISCSAANVTDYAAVPPGLRAVSFVMSPSDLGSPDRNIGLVPMSEYSKVLEGSARQRDVTVPAALAISGAAISPAMGKASRPWLTALLAAANVRLGVWLPNPRWIDGVSSDDETWFERPRVSYLFKEMFGIHSMDDRFVYVTDGGHYDNLGLVELLRRGCTKIVAVDASGGQPGTFATLTEAIALASSELGVTITIDLQTMRPTDENAAKQYEEGRLKLPWRRRQAEARGGVLIEQPYVVGKIEYDNAVIGEICYIQAAVTPTTPWPVRAYWERDDRFPNHSTADQDFDHEEFEAYRALGYWATTEGLKNIQF